MTAPRALVLTGYGINCETETKQAIEKCGGKANVLHLNQLLQNPKLLEAYDLLVIPGGFSFGDELGSGRVFANRMKYHLTDALTRHIKNGKLILGIGNGFQILVKLGLLPEPEFIQKTSIIGNDSGRFEDRWVLLKVNQRSPCIFTKGIGKLLLPIRHGEGKFIVKDESVLQRLVHGENITLQYIDEKENTNTYPYNPNGSVLGIAGISDKSGRIFGLMPHPEAFNIPENCPYWPTGAIKEAMGMKIFRNAIEYIKEK